MKKYEITTQAGNNYVAYLYPSSAKAIAKKQLCKVYAVKEGSHTNPFMR